jgi:hypothetical protein
MPLRLLTQQGSQPNLKISFSKHFTPTKRRFRENNRLLVMYVKRRALTTNQREEGDLFIGYTHKLAVGGYQTNPVLVGLSSTTPQGQL